MKSVRFVATNKTIMIESPGNRSIPGDRGGNYIGEDFRRRNAPKLLCRSDLLTREFKQIGRAVIEIPVNSPMGAEIVHRDGVRKRNYVS